MKVSSPDLRFRPGRVLSLGIIVCAMACSPRVVEKVVTKIEYRDVHHRDTTIQHDSTFIKEYVKGDTVHHYEYRDRYIFRDRWRDSTVTKEVHDTTTVEKQVEKELSRSQKAKIDSFWWLVLAVAGLAGWTFRKPIVKLLKTILK